MTRKIPWIAAALLAALPTYLPAAAEEPKEASLKESAKKPAASATASPIKKLMEIRLDSYLIPARALNISLPGRTRTVRDLLEQMEKWSKDDAVGAVLFNLDGVGLAIPDIEELRAGVESLKQSGKKVHAFLNTGEPNGYLLACQANEIAIAPTGSLAIPGMGRLFGFMRGMYQMQGIEYDVITAGAYKYPGFMNQREPNKYFTEEFNEILDSWFEDYVNIIATGRKLTPEKVKQAIDVAMFDAEEARQHGLVDVISYYEEYVERVLKREKYKRSDVDGSGLSQITSLQDLLTSVNEKLKETQAGYKAVGPKIAVLHARGPIIDQDLGPGLASMVIMRDPFVKTIEEIRKNKTVRAVVLRIDSPGGSGYASDVIWRKLKELDEEKPIVVSMGSVAGSGGYYIACPGRLIFADPTTITGSIGVLAILGNQASMLNRMDVNIAEMKRGARSLLGAGHRDIQPEDRQFIQQRILDFYEIFLDRVAEGRRMPKDQVRKIAGGRIYTGRQGKAIGLVDRLGGLKDAIDAAREMADIPPSSEIRLVHYPRPSSLGEFLFGGASPLMSAESAVELVRRVQQPVPAISFDSEVRHFARRLMPLCWMAMPTQLWSASPMTSPLGNAAPAGLGEIPEPARPQVIALPLGE